MNYEKESKMDYEKEIWIKKEKLRIEIRNSVKFRDKKFENCDLVDFTTSHVCLRIFILFYLFIAPAGESNPAGSCFLSCGRLFTLPTLT